MEDALKANESLNTELDGITSKLHPTPFMPAFRTKQVKIGVRMKNGKAEEESLAVEYRCVCPWNPETDLLSDECMKCEYNRRTHKDTNYPSFATVCQCHINKEPIPEHLKKRVREIHNQRITRETPSAVARHRMYIEERIRKANRNARMSIETKTRGSRKKKKDE